jgi:hypothetical protein
MVAIDLLFRPRDFDGSGFTCEVADRAGNDGHLVTLGGEVTGDLVMPGSAWFV